MAIRFVCPSCRQPLEIDDQWAGQSVGCPYCKRVVAAPQSSNWPPGEIPVAAPAGGSAFDAPPPPAGQPQAFGLRPAPAGSAPWALTFAITCAVLSVVGWLVWWFTLIALAQRQTGQNATPQQLTKVMQEIMASGQTPRPTFAAAAALIGALCGIAGLVMSVRSLLRQEPRRLMAVTACVISACFICCQLGLILFLSTSGTVPP